MSRKVLFFSIFLICFLSNGFASLYFGYRVHSNSITRDFKIRVEQSVILLKNQLQKGDYREYAFATKKFFSSVQQEVSVYLYSDINQSPIFSLGEEKFETCEKDAFSKVKEKKKIYIYCQDIDGIVVKLTKPIEPTLFFQIEELHLIVSILTSILCSIFLILLMKKYFSDLLDRFKILIQDPNKQTMNDDLSWLKQPILDMCKTIDSLKEKLSEKDKTETLAKGIRQIAHDLGSPLSALNILSKKLSEDGSRFSPMVESLQRRLTDIVEQLRSQSKIRIDILEKFDLKKEILVVCRDLKYCNEKITLKGDFQGGDDGFVYGQGPIFSRVLDCLVQNSVEAEDVGRPLQIIVELTEFTHFICVKVADTGKGISSNDLKYVTLSGVSIGKDKMKSSGSGLGLSFAFEKIEGWGGSASISSELGRGTTVELTFLKANRS